jgi:hypothetical protein
MSVAVICIRQRGAHALSRDCHTACAGRSFNVRHALHVKRIAVGTSSLLLLIIRLCPNLRQSVLL